MKLEDTHGGFAGKSLQDKIRDDLDQAFADFKGKRENSLDRDEWIMAESFAEGIAHALGVLRGTGCEKEWQDAQHRWDMAP